MVNAEPVAEVTTIEELAQILNLRTISNESLVQWRTHDLVTGQPLTKPELQELFTHLKLA